MIANAPVAASDTFLSIQMKVSAFLGAARSSAENGITWAEFGELLVALLRIAIETLDQTLSLSGAEKKAIVLEAAAALFDQVADKCIPAAFWPVWVFVKPSVRSLVLAIAAGAVEQILKLVRAEK